MLKYYNIYVKELKRVRDEEPHTSHGGLWKYFFKWKKLSSGNSVDAKLPWISFPVIDFLERILKPDSKVFEYGGGGSTLFFTERSGEVITIEHNKEWFGILTNKVTRKDNWKGNFIESEPANNYTLEQATDPDKYFSTDKEFVNRSFYKYATFIDQYPDNYFDVVLIDGRARPSCIKHGLPKIKQGGYLIVDNADRPYYTEQFKNVLKEQYEEVINFSGPTPFCSWFNLTGVWRKK
ncbi:MAG TPA: hypothetical protein VNX68_04805 [Nitrosopumilaceae archaeon]|jgi:hypothetical protein|nr:hypothetical protein [Nitrosopumilaceae archaeon]